VRWRIKLDGQQLTLLLAAVQADKSVRLRGALGGLACFDVVYSRCQLVPLDGATEPTPEEGGYVQCSTESGYFGVLWLSLFYGDVVIAEQAARGEWSRDDDNRRT
jgi:hypothetical protein